MGPPGIDVVVPVHNGWELTKSCLTHLRAQTLPHAVFVADNGSTDGTPERLRREFPQVRVVELGANLGFPAACNRGARAGRGDVVVLLNNDVDARPDFLERLVAPFDAEQRLGSVAALLLTSAADRIESFGLTVDPTFAGYPRLRGRAPTEAQPTTPALVGPSGAGGAYRRRAWDEVGGLDEGVRFYGEDVDLALRLRAAGWTTTAAADAVALHLGSATAAHRSDSQRYESGFARGYFLRRYGVLRGRAGPRAAVIEAMVVVGDAALFSHDLAALRGRLHGWRAARGKPRVVPPRDAADRRITFVKSVRERLNAYSASTSS